MKVLVVGQGELGWRITQILAQYEVVEELLAADVNPAQEGRTNMVRYGAQLLGLKTAVRFETLNALDSGAVERLLSDYRPDVIVNTASLQSWHVIQQLPQELWERIHSGGLGIWLPAHLAPTYTLMQALCNIGQEPLVINMAFADVVNVMLHRIGLAPTMGAGNIEELVAPVTRAVAEHFNSELERVRVRMVGHHWVNAAVLESRQVDDIPIIVHVELDGRDVTGELDVPKLLLEATEAFPPGFEDTWLIAASASHKVLAAFGAAPNAGHATAVNGNPGGYPVSFTNGIAELDLPPGVSVEDAVKVNLEGQRRDGIAEIRSDGEAVLAEHATAVMRDVLGWEYTSYRVEDSPQMALEITRRYREFAARVRHAA
jgi:hypothetical protein